MAALVPDVTCYVFIGEQIFSTSESNLPSYDVFISDGASLNPAAAG